MTDQSEPQQRRSWNVEATCPDPDEMSWQLIDLGAEGVELLSDSAVRAFFTGSSLELAQFVSGAEAAGFTVSRAVPVEEKNWLENCRGLYDIVEIGALRIVPISDIDVPVADENPERDIILIPGQGFGTGHHESTKQILGYLQSADLAARRPRRVLDFGTGSGVLAIACCKLFGSSVSAIDISGPALENARRNAARNGVLDSIRFIESEPEERSDAYDLITANLYAELLAAYEPMFRRTLIKGGRLIVAGILESLYGEVEQAFSGWSLLARRQDNEWIGCCFEK